ncbi:MAG: Arm DNA-binding domain-containing protein [Clostridiales Family XIII bacterium]|jgi:hypothetical protein|nr:Arm DNA-binding domain-containing protein [Clostridiales Family XIII bacterium]
MSVHKEKTGKYRAVIKYKDYEGNIKCTSKRGFSRKQDALKYEINFINKAKDESSYVFERFVKEIYLKDLKLNVKITTVFFYS